MPKQAKDPPPPPPPSASAAPSATGGAAVSEEASTVVRDEEAWERLEAQAHELLASARRELGHGRVEAGRAGRLHYEVARLLAFPLDEMRRATTIYREAVSLLPDELVLVHGLRRTLLGRRRYEEALEALAEELRLRPQPVHKAALSYLQGVVLEDHLDRSADARAGFAVAWELGRGMLAALLAMEASQGTAGKLDALDRTWERLASALAEEPAWRASVLADRGWLAERRGRGDAAVEHYLGALDVDATSTERSAVALEALLAARGRWRELGELRRRAAEAIEEPAARALRLAEAAAVFASRHVGDEETALQLLEQAWPLASEEPWLLEQLAAVYERRKRFDALVQVLLRREQVAEDSQEKLALWQRIGALRLEELDDPRGALEAWRQALRIDPLARPALDRALALLERFEAWPDAVALLREAAERAPEVEERVALRLRVAGLLADRLERPEEAIEEVLGALQADPRHDEALRVAARLLGRAGRWRDLIERYERAVDVALDGAERTGLLLRIGALLETRLEAPEEAAEAYRRAAAGEHSALVALRGWQRAAGAAGRAAELLEAYRQELAAEPSEPRRVELLLRMAQVHAGGAGEEPKAVSLLQQVLALRPGHGAALGLLERLHERTGRWEDLLEVLRRRLEATSQPERRVELLLRMAAVAEQRLGREALAADLYEEVLGIQPGHAVARAAFARILQREGELERLAEALAAWSQSEASAPAQARTLHRLGALLEELGGRQEEALAAYRRAARADETFTPALRAALRLAAVLERWEELVELLQEAERCLPTEAERRGARLWRADLLADRLGRRRVALGLLEELLSERPGHVDALRRTIRWAIGERAWKQAYEAWCRLAEVARGDRAVVGALTEALRLAGGRLALPPMDRVRLAQRLLERAPGDVLALEAFRSAAIEARDMPRLLKAYTMSAEAEEAPALAAAYLVRRGELLEAMQRPDALEAFKQALSLDAENVGASRGLSRLAERLGDPAALSEAARREAQVVGDPQEAARLLLRSATLRAERLGDEAGAVEDLEQAIEMDPQSEAVDLLEGLLRRRGEEERLASMLSRVAEHAERPERRAELYRRLARLQAGPLERLSAAIGSLTRALKVQPDDVRCLLELAALYERDQQWPEAIRLLERVVKRGTEREDIFEAHLRLARLWSEHGGDPQRALVSLQAVLALERDHREALSRLLALHEAQGRHAEALQVAERLVEVSEPGPGLAEALLARARLLDEAGRVAEATTDLLQALQWEGPGGEASALLRSRLQDRADWERYLQALEQHAERAGPSVGLELERFRAIADGLGELERALAALRSAVERHDDPRLRRELASRLQQGGHVEAAEEAWLDLLERHPMDLEARRALMRLHEAQGRPYEARCVLETLAVLGGQLEEDDARLLATHTGRRWKEGALDREALLALCGFGRSERAAADLLIALRPALPKLHPADLEAFGLTSRDRLTSRSGDPVRALADRCASVLGGPDFELGVHALPRREGELQMGSPPWLLVPRTELERPAAGRVLLLAEPLALVAMGLELLARLTPREVQILAAAAVRPLKEDFGRGLTAEDELQSLSKRLYKALPWLGRRPVHEAAAAYAEVARKVDFGRFVQKARRAALLVASLLADDLSAALSHVRRTRPELQDLSTDQIVTRSELVRDLLAFWVSPGAHALRRRLGVSA